MVPRRASSWFLLKTNTLENWTKLRREKGNKENKVEKRENRPAIGELSKFPGRKKKETNERKQQKGQRRKLRNEVWWVGKKEIGAGARP